MNDKKETLNNLLMYSSSTVFLYVAATNLQEAYKHIAHTAEGQKIGAILEEVGNLLQVVGMKADSLSYPVLGEEPPVENELNVIQEPSSGGCGSCPSRH